MNNFSLKKILIALLALGGGSAALADCTCVFNNPVELQLYNGGGCAPVEGTNFSANLKVLKEGYKVTVQWPTINFQVGMVSTDTAVTSTQTDTGYLYTVDGFLPESVRPAEAMPISAFGMSGNGYAPVFSFTESFSLIPAPVIGYNVQITNAGAFQVLGVGTVNNAIPSGPQSLLAGSMTYVTEQQRALCNNVVLSTGFSNTIAFTDPQATNALRDFHVNDAFNGVVAYAWSDNSNIPQDISTLNLKVAIGRVVDGQLVMRAPVQITNFGPNVIAWDTSIAINRLNPNNIVVSYYMINGNDDTLSRICRAVSFDGGLTFGGVFDGVNLLPLNGPLANQPDGGSGDVPGVRADQFGNFWYMYNTQGLVPNQFYLPTFQISNDQGITFVPKYIASPAALTPGQSYDYPQYTFGTFAGEYGAYYVSAINDSDTEKANKVQQVGFVPLSATPPTVVQLPQLLNAIQFPLIEATNDGRLWLFGSPNTFGTGILPAVITYKSPGLLNENYAGVWDVALANFCVPYFSLDNDGNISATTQSGYDSQPVFGFVHITARSLLYDNQRQALYALVSAKTPDYSQNMRIMFTISRDNGMTWSTPININSSNLANRGFQSMALDPITGNLLFGWYDGRNMPYQDLQYFGTVLPAAKLTALVNAIPLSNPQFTVPAA